MIQKLSHLQGVMQTTMQMTKTESKTTMTEQKNSMSPLVGRGGET